MSVTFNRNQLIAVTNRALNAHGRAAEQRAKQVAKYRSDHALAAIKDTHLAARNLREALTKAIKKAAPVTYQELERALGGNSLRDTFYREPSDWEVKKSLDGVPEGLMTPSEVIEARALLAVLNAATGDTISANELKLLGLKNLQPVFTAAAKAS